jgi:uncharacterized Fe-S cluster protein YjdI
MKGDDRNDANERDYSNGEITVFWKPSKCIHVTTCYRELIEVFNPSKRPWINMQGAPTDEIIRVVNLCPTQALSYNWNKDINPVNKDKEDKNADIPGTATVQPPVTEVRVMKDGPLIIKGIFKIIGSSGIELSQMKHVSFCRCGKSMKMPFCDGTHRNTGFKAD